MYWISVLQCTTYFNIFINKRVVRIMACYWQKSSFIELFLCVSHFPHISCKFYQFCVIDDILWQNWILEKTIHLLSIIQPLSCRDENLIQVCGTLSLHVHWTLFIYAISIWIKSQSILKAWWFRLYANFYPCDWHRSITTISFLVCPPWNSDSLWK